MTMCNQVMCKYEVSCTPNLAYINSYVHLHGVTNSLPFKVIYVYDLVTLTFSLYIILFLNSTLLIFLKHFVRMSAKFESPLSL
jgi:hypothetical protein